MSEPKDERTVTQQNHPASGAVTNPAQQGTATAAPKPVDDRTATMRQGRETIDPDFDLAPPRDGGRPNVGDPLNPTEPQQGTNPQQPNPVQQMVTDGIRIKFNGQEEVIPLDKATIMLQQYKNVSKFGDIHSLTNDFMQQTGITDPKQAAALIAQALMAQYGQQQQAPAAAQSNPAAATDPAGGGAAPNVEALNQAMAAAAALQAGPDPAVVAQVKANFEAQGLNLPDDMIANFAMMQQYGQQVTAVAKALPMLAAEINVYKQQQAQNAELTQQAAVDAQAAKTAQELGIDTPEEVEAFTGWVKQMDQGFPGFQEDIRTDPQKMDLAIRQFYYSATGQRAIEQRNQTHQQVNTDLARAGGDGVPAARPGGMGGANPAGSNDAAKFNRDMMDAM